MYIFIFCFPLFVHGKTTSLSHKPAYKATAGGQFKAFFNEP